MVKLVAIATLLASTAAHAEAPVDDVSPETAQRLSAIGSAVPLATIGLGALVWATGSSAPIRDLGMGLTIGGALAGIVTPSLGELYSHRWWNGTMAIRTGGLVVEFAGLIHTANSDLGDCADTSGPCHLHASTYGLLIGGAALYLGATLFDVYDAPHAARAWNSSLQLGPTALRTPSGTVAGVGASFTF